MNANLTVTHTQEYLPEGQQDLLQSGNCQKCGTGLKPGAEFCHVCGRWVFGSSFAQFVNSARAAMALTRLEVPVLVCLVVAAIFVVISLFVGSRMTPKTIGEWQVIQFWRIEWLLGAIIALLFGVLLRRRQQ
jgi:hypothetical protein